MITVKSYLCGEWQAGEGEGGALYNPTTGEVIAHASTKGLDMKAAVDYAKNVGGPNLRKLTFAERGAMLKALSAALHEAREDLITVSTENGGSTRKDAKFDVDGGSGTMAAYASMGKKLGDKRFLVDGEGAQLTRSARFYGYHLKHPREGVAVHINAFNFPCWGLAEKFSVAFLAGMPVIAKPATSTALVAFRMMEAIANSGILPEGALQFVGGGAGDLLSHLDHQDVMAFTGGSDTAVMLRNTEAIVKNSVRMNVEADSLNAVVLTDDAERGGEIYNTFINHIILEMTQKAGQKCTGTRRIFVPKGRIDEVQEDITERLADAKVGNPATAGVSVGPLATKRQLEDARKGIGMFLESGARIVFGDTEKVDVVDADASEGYFISPVLLRTDDPANTAAVHAHEVFGPVSTLMPYENTDELVDLVARGGGGLVSSIYGDDNEVAGAILHGIAPYLGRILWVNGKTVDQTISPGMVLPTCVHGGPGRAGGGEELGGLRGLDFYMQRTAVQGDRGALERMLGMRE